MSGDERDKRRNGGDSDRVILEDDAGPLDRFERKAEPTEDEPGTLPSDPSAQPGLCLDDIGDTEIDELLNIEETDDRGPRPAPETETSSSLMDLEALLESVPVEEDLSPAAQKLPHEQPPRPEPHEPEPVPAGSIRGLFAKRSPSTPPSFHPPDVTGDADADGSETDALLSDLLGTKPESGPEELFQQALDTETDVRRTQSEPALELEPPVSELREIAELLGDQIEPEPELEPLASAPSDAVEPSEIETVSAQPEVVEVPPAAEVAESERASTEPTDSAEAEKGIEIGSEAEYREVSRPSDVPISGSGLLTIALSRAPFTAVDEGAEAAKRTIRRRTDPGDHASLVGTGPDVDRARMDLLEHLAEGSGGSVRSRLLTAAAEIGEALGEVDRAGELYTRAYQSDSTDPFTVREARKRAMLAEQWPEAEELLKTESGLALGTEERALVLVALAELRLWKLEDANGAREAAIEALRIHPRCLSAAILIREIELAEDRTAEAAAVLGSVEANWQDPRARSALLFEAGRIVERAGRVADALGFYRRGSDIDPRSVGNRLAQARCARAAGDANASIQALLETKELLEPCPEREEIVRTAARYAQFLAGRPEQAIELLQDDESLPGLRARARAAEASGDRESYLSALRSWAEKTEGTEKALALFELGRDRFEKGELQQAIQDLAEAYAADGSLETVTVMRNLIAQQVGDAAGLDLSVLGVQELDPVKAAAKAVHSNERQKLERELLDRACRLAEQSTTTETIATDAAAEAGRLKEVREALLREADRNGESCRPGLLLSWIDLAQGRASGGESSGASEPETGPEEKVLEVLKRARDVAGDSAGTIRRIARYTGEPSKAADLWLGESALAQGQHAAFAARQAGRLLEASGGDAIGAFSQALQRAPDYLPAYWALDLAAVRAGDRSASAFAHEQLALRAAQERTRAEHLILAALLETGQDSRKVGALLEQASGLFPEDSVLKQLILRNANGSQPERFAQILLQSAEGLDPAWSLAARLRAASAYEDGGQPEEAVELYKAIVSEDEKRREEARTAESGLAAAGSTELSELSTQPDAERSYPPGSVPSELESSTPLAATGLYRAQLAAGQIEQVLQRLSVLAERAESEQARQAALLARARLMLETAQSPEELERASKSLLEMEPRYLVASRALEREHMSATGDESLRETSGQILGGIDDPVDVAGYLRWITRLEERRDEQVLEQIDELVLREGVRAQADFWVSHRLEAAARRSFDAERIVDAIARTASLYADPHERCSITLRLAEILESVGYSQRAAEELQRAVNEAPDHPVAAEELGRLYEVSGEHTRAAEAFEAESNADRRSRLWHRAGVLWQDQIEDDKRAVAAFGNIGSQDAIFRDAYTRMHQSLGEKGKDRKLIELIEQRLQVGGIDKAEQVKLHIDLSRLQFESGEREAAKRSLGAAVELDPENVDVLRGLAEFFLQDQQWEQATAPLIALARTEKEKEPLIWAFMRLGEIYDCHLPDLQRAEVSYTRVVSMDSEHVEAIERLVQVFKRQKQLQKALRALNRLIALAADAENKRGYMLQMAETYEQLDRPREAELVLKGCRQEAPFDMRVIRALSAFYRRQKAYAALSVQLSIICREMRNAVSADPSDLQSWKNLIEVLNEQGQRRAARCCASTSRAFDVGDAELEPLLEQGSAAPVCRKALRDRAIDRIIAPPLLNETTRLVLRSAAPAMENLLPLELERYGAKRLKRRPTGAERALAVVCEWFGIRQVSTYSVQARLCLPVSSDPLTLLIGEPLLEETGEAEQIFLFARAAKIAHQSLCPVMRATPLELALAIDALARYFDTSYEPKGVNLEKLDEMARRIGKFIPRRVHETLGQSVYEMKGLPGFDPVLLPEAAQEMGARSALVAIGDSVAALGALLALGESGVRAGRSETLAAVSAQPEASALYTFALSDVFFDACQKAQQAEEG